MKRSGLRGVSFNRERACGRARERLGGGEGTGPSRSLGDRHRGANQPSTTVHCRVRQPSSSEHAAHRDIAFVTGEFEERLVAALQRDLRRPR